MQSKHMAIAFRRWALYRKVERRLKAHNRRIMLLRFKEWRALGAWRFRLRTAAMDIQRIVRGVQCRKRVRKLLLLRRHQMTIVNKVSCAVGVMCEERVGSCA